MWLNSSTSGISSSSLLTRPFSLPGPVFEGGRENSFVWQDVLPADWAVSCSPGGRANVERSGALQRAGAGDVTSWHRVYLALLLKYLLVFIWHKHISKLTFCFVFTQIRVGALNSELLELRSQLEDAASVHERELHSFRETCTDLQSRADVALKEVDDAVQVRIWCSTNQRAHTSTCSDNHGIHVLCYFHHIRHGTSWENTIFSRECFLC